MAYRMNSFGEYIGDTDPDYYIDDFADSDVYHSDRYYEWQDEYAEHRDEWKEAATDFAEHSEYLDDEGLDVYHPFYSQGEYWENDDDARNEERLDFLAEHRDFVPDPDFVDEVGLYEFGNVYDDDFLDEWENRERDEIPY